MKNKIKDSSTLDKVTCSIFTIGVVLYLVSFAFYYDCFKSAEQIISYSIRSLPFILLIITAFNSNKHNARRMVAVNVSFLAISFIISAFDGFSPMVLNNYFGIDNFIWYIILAFVSIVVAGLSSHCSNIIIYIYGLSMSVISLLRPIYISYILNAYDVTDIWLIGFAVVSYFFTLIAMAERFSDENIHTNFIDKIFDNIARELNKDDDFEFDYGSYYDIFKAMIMISIPENSKKVIDYYNFYKLMKKSKFDTLEKRGFLNKAFIVEFCEYIANFMDKYGDKEDDIVLGNIAKILSNENTSNDEFKVELINLLALFSNGFAISVSKSVKKLDIKYSSDNETGSALSNFTNHQFTVCGESFNSMESFLQGLKFKNKKKQEKIWILDGAEAKRKGKYHNFWKYNGGNLYFKGEPINRFSEEYQNVLDNAYDALLENKEFSKALMATVDENGVKTLFSHSIGKCNPYDTVLTEEEFIDRLYSMRKKLMQKND